MKTVFSGDHPAFPGHFPGHPIVPGVLLLERARHLIERHERITFDGLQQAKFLRPVGPNHDLTLHYQMTDTMVAFEWQDAVGVVASGRFVRCGHESAV